MAKIGDGKVGGNESADTQPEQWAEIRDKAAREDLREWMASGCPGPSRTADTFADMMRQNSIRRALGIPIDLNLRRLQEQVKTEHKDLADWSNRRGKQFRKVLGMARSLDHALSGLRELEKVRPKSQPTPIEALTSDLAVAGGAARRPREPSYEGMSLRYVHNLVILARRELEPLFSVAKRKRGPARTAVTRIADALKKVGLTDRKIAMALQLEGLVDIETGNPEKQMRDRRRKARMPRNK